MLLRVGVRRGEEGEVEVGVVGGEPLLSWLVSRGELDLASLGEFCLLLAVLSAHVEEGRARRGGHHARRTKEEGRKGGVETVVGGWSWSNLQPLK